MSLIITKGYLINAINCDTFDEIITFINEYGNRFTCIAKGVKKISSKNSRSLIIGNFNEFEFFLARFENRISKLKKVTTIEQINWEILSKQSFNLLNEICYKTNIFNKELFFFYKNNLEIIQSDINDQAIIIKILVEYIKNIGINLEINHCCICKSNRIKSFSIRNLGFVCQNCFDEKRDNLYNVNFLKLIREAFVMKDINQILSFNRMFNELIILLRNIIYENDGLILETLSNY